MSGADVMLLGVAAGLAAVGVDLSARILRRRAGRTAFLLLALGSGLVAAAGAMAVATGGFEVDLSWWDLPGGTRSLVDPVGGLFLLVSFVAATAACLHASGAGPGPRLSPVRGLPSLVGLLLAGMLVVLVATDVYLFLLGWETVTVAFYLLTVHDRDAPDGLRTRAGVVAAVFGKGSGGAVLVGFLLLAASAGTMQLSGLDAATGAARQAGYALLLLGFATKAGMVPLHVWLPNCYASAPAAARAVMAGAAVNVGFYGMWRTLDLLGGPPVGLALGFMLVAAASALLGIAHVSVQSDLLRVIGYSSVENAGLIGIGFGTAMVGASIESPFLLSLGIVTATLQVVAHALAKTVLFASSGTIVAAHGTSDLEELRGVGRRFRWNTGGFLAGALTLAGLPLTIGFVSEWYLLQTLMQLFRSDSDVVRLVLATAGASVALTAGFAGFAFVRLVGLMLFGPATPRHPSRVSSGAREPRALGPRLAVIMLAGGSLAAAATTPWLIGMLARALAPVVPESISNRSLVSPLVVQPVFAGFSSLSPSWLWIVLPLLTLVATLVFVALSRGQLFRVRRVPAWRSAAGGGHGTVSYTPYAFSGATRRVLSNVLQVRSSLQPTSPEPAITAGQEHAVYQGDVVEVVEEYLYRPLLRPMLALVGLARRLQSGRLDAYLTYMLLALLAVLAVVAAAV